MLLEHFTPVAPEKAYRMFNLGATALVLFLLKEHLLLQNC